MKSLLRVLSGLCFVPVIGFPAHFFWTFGSAPWQEKPLQWMPGGLLPVYMLLIFTVVPAGLTEVKLPPGVYAKAVHHGAYSGLPAAWAGLKKWIAANDHRIVPRASFELYPNDPGDTAEADLITELYFPVS